MSAGEPAFETLVRQVDRLATGQERLFEETRASGEKTDKLTEAVTTLIASAAADKQWLRTVAADVARVEDTAAKEVARVEAATAREIARVESAVARAESDSKAETGKLWKGVWWTIGIVASTIILAAMGNLLA